MLQDVVQVTVYCHPSASNAASLPGVVVVVICARWLDAMTVAMLDMEITAVLQNACQSLCLRVQRRRKQQFVSVLECFGSVVTCFLKMCLFILSSL